MKRTSRKVTTTEYIDERYKLNEFIKMFVSYVDGKITNVSFFRVSDRYCKNELTFVKDPKEFAESIKKENPFYGYSKKDSIWKTQVIETPEELFGLISSDDYTNDQFVELISCDHTVKNYKGDYMDIMIRLDYICGFKQNNGYRGYSPEWDWEKLRKRLNRCKHVIKCEEETIPHYNCDFSGQKAFQIDVVFEGSWMPVNKKKDKYFSLDEYIMDMNIDPLKVKSCIKKEK